MTQFEEQRRAAEEFCFGNRTKKSYLEDFLVQSEQRQIPIQEWDAEIIAQILSLKKSVHSFGNSKAALTAFCKYAEYKNVLEALSQVKYTNMTKYYPSFNIMREEIQSNIENINPYDIRQYDNLVIVAYLVAMGLTPKEIAELKKANYQNGVIRIGRKNYICPDDFVDLLKAYDLTDSYVVECSTKLRTMKYRDTDYFLKSTSTSDMSLKTVYLYTKKLPIICGDKGFYEIQQSKIMWDLLLEYGYDLENPNVLKDTDWESVKQKVKDRIPIVEVGMEASDRNAFLDVLIQYRNDTI